MQVKTVRACYARTWNLGDYESMKIGCDAEASLDPGESPEEAAAALFEVCKEVVKEQSMPVVTARDAKATRLATEALEGIGK